MEDVFSCGSILCGVGALIIGSLAAVFNSRLMEKHKNDEINKLAAISLIRMLTSFAVLAAVFFLVRALGFDYLLPLLGAAVGLTVPSVIIAVKTAKALKKGDDSNG